MLNSRQRAQLRGMANGLDPIFQIGKAGIGDQLIKLTVLETSPQRPRECADKVSEATGSDVVQVIGSKFILYKESTEHKTIVLCR